MKYFSTFSGIGGFELGIGGGAECIGYSEIDKWAIQIYQKHFPEHKNYGDITKITAGSLPDFDLFVGGFPCQAFSIAGKRRGFDDTRGTLFFDIARILREKRPRLLLLENVKGLLSHDNGRTFKTIVATLAELGYDLQWQVLNSKNHGVPQNRERIFIVGHLRGTARPKIFPYREDENLYNQTAGTEKPRPQTQLGTTLKAAGNIKSDDTFIIDPPHKHGEIREYKNEVPTMQARWGTGGNNVPYVKQRPRGDNKGGIHEIAPTLSTNSYQNNNHLIENQTIRRLTPIECERLQGFPDNWTTGMSDSHRYKTLGNAVTVNVIRDIMQKLL